MSSGLLTIMQHYAQNKDAAVRRNLCDALVADGSPEAADILLDLATQDPDAEVNALAAEQIAGLSPKQLEAVQPTLAQRFSPEKGKGQTLNWVRCANRIAKGTHTSLFAGLGTWRQEVRATRKLNRRLLLSRKNEFGLGARLLNRHMLISIIAAVALTMIMFALLVRNPHSELSWGLPFIGAISIVLAGIPLAVMFAPPTLAFRRSVIAYVDAMTVVKFAAVPIILIWLLSVAFGETLDAQFFGPILLYIVLPLFLVRLALNVATHVRQRLAYPLLLCLVAMGVLVAVYSILLWILDAIAPRWYEYGNIMSGLLTMIVPMSLFMAIHQGSFGNQVTQTGETPRSVIYNKLHWMSFAGLASAFIVVVAIAPATGVAPPGRGESTVIQLAGIDGNGNSTAPALSEEGQHLVSEIKAALQVLMVDIAEEGGNRQVVSYIEEMLPKITPSASFRLLRTQADGLLDAVYVSNLPSEKLIAFETIANQLYQLSDVIEFSRPVNLGQTVVFDRTSRIIFEATSPGYLAVSVTATRNERQTDVVIWLNGTMIDERSWSDPELFEGEIRRASNTLIADVPARKVNMDSVVSHFQTRIAYLVNTVLSLDMETRNNQDGTASDLMFSAVYNWAPNPAPVDKKSGPSF
ncbi:HEAT repeat domain-containing protein [Tateyamaria armeniaca]|uniref:HEAT repeat domain-containing protein n=1 Tax=Tateyamaria armeniaca TaxID=2518930 RepID=A0ABW8UU76_9RHOB